MLRFPIRVVLASVALPFALPFALAACSHPATPVGAGAEPQTATASPTALARANAAAVQRARADSARLPYTAADVQFMSTMIGHHAQAIVMSRLAPTHAESPSVKTLAERIINAQSDEIRIMQQWLRDRGQTVPEGAPTADMHAGMEMGSMPMGSTPMAGQTHAMMMPGMLTEAQMQALDAARGAEFDRLFLAGMIQHHGGAVSMVKDLFESPGAGQDEKVFKFATDVNVDQTTEIARMQRMLIMLAIEREPGNQ